MHQRVSELAALVDRAWRLWRDVGGHATRKRELAEQPAHALLVLADSGIDLRVRPLEIRIRDQPWPAVPGASHVDRVQIARSNRAVHMGVEQIEARSGAPVPQQSRLDMLDLQRLPEQRVVEQVDLPYREIVRRTPVGVDQL